jgi:hypothetical protein
MTPPDVAWARPGATTFPPPQALVTPPQSLPAPAPPTPPPPADDQRRGLDWKLIAPISLALVLATAAVVMSVVKLAEPAPVATTTTVTAAPAGPAFTPDQVAAAKKQACDAVDTADGPITSAQRDFYAARLDRNSPQYQQMLSNWQTVSAIEIEYTRAHLTPAAPPAVAEAINTDLRALAALVDANTRGVPDAQADILIDKLKATGAQVTKVCEE